MARKKWLADSFIALLVEIEGFNWLSFSQDRKLTDFPYRKRSSPGHLSGIIFLARRDSLYPRASLWESSKEKRGCYGT